MKKILMILMVFLLIGCQDNITEETEIFEDEITIESEVVTVFTSTTLEDFYEELFIKIMSYNPQWIDDLGDLSDYGVSF